MDDPYLLGEGLDVDISETSGRGDAPGGPRAGAQLAQQMAAESIQSTFRRYRECKTEIRLRKKKSESNLVMNLAAETITSGLRRIASKSRSQAQSEVSSIEPPPPTSRVEKDSSAITTTGNSPTRTGAPTLRVLRITNLAISDVPSVVWQGTNEMYCVLGLKDWSHRTPTVADKSGSARWADRTIDLPLVGADGVNTTPADIAREVLTIAIMHENLVLADKAIGQGEVAVTLLFPDIVNSDAFISDQPIEYELTAYEGTKLKRKAKGTIKFTAQVVAADFRPAGNATKLVAPAVQAKESLEFRMDSASVSLASRSIDPYALREDSNSICDFSSAQLRNAADLLQDWEEPIVRSAPVPAAPAASGKLSSSSKLSPAAASQSGSLPAKVARNVSAVSAPDKSAAKPKNAFTTPPAVPPAAPPAALSENKARDGPPRAASPSALSSAKASTRLRSRRTDTPEASDAPPVEAAPPAPPKARRTSSAGADQTVRSSDICASIKRSIPNTDVVRVLPQPGASNALPPKAAAGSAVQKSRGNQAFDEAFHLAMRKKGSFVKLTQGEFARLLETLLFEVRPELLSGPERLSCLLSEESAMGKTSSWAPARTADEADQDVSLPVVHAMSLAATISFAVRDGDLLVGPSQAGRFTPDSAAADLVTMSEGQSERALQQLRGLIEGPYADIKMCILRLCGCTTPAASSGRTSPAMSQTKTAATPVAVRPSAWSAEDVTRFLHSVKVVPGKTDAPLTGESLLKMESHALKACFGANPSLDRARLGVYLQTLRHLDQWWDRGIRPADIMGSEDMELAEGLGGQARGKKSKRRSSKSGSLSNAWGELAPVLDAATRVYNGSREGTLKAVDGGKVLDSHLLQIADFQPLLEAMTPLNRAFGWGCSLESLVRFSSIIGGMRGYLWLRPLPADGEDALEVPRSSNHSIAGASHAGSVDELHSQSSWLDRPLADDVAQWVVLQKSSAASTTELTQLIRLCNELRVVMKYAAREDDFLAYVPVGCLRITSVQEIKAKKFEAELQGLLLEDLSVGKHVTIAGMDALARTCERFDWWDRPTPAMIESMGGQVGEVVSLAEAQDKRRIGVRLVKSGLCDALPLEALRLCTEAELRALREDTEQTQRLAQATTQVDRAGRDNEEVAATKPARRKVKAATSEARKSKLRTLIRNLNIKSDPQKEAPPPAVPVAPKPRAKPPRAPTPPSTAKVQRELEDEEFGLHASKSELSNLSGDPDEELVLTRPSPSKKARRSFSAKLNTTAPVVAPIPTKAAPAKPSPTRSPGDMVSPQKRIVRRTMVRNDQIPSAPLDDQLLSQLQHGDESAAPPPSSAGAARVAAKKPVYDSAGNLYVETAEPADYSWLRSSKRSPLIFPDEVPNVPAPVPEPPARPVEQVKRVGPTPLHVVQASFDPKTAEYTEGVRRYATDGDPEADAVGLLSSPVTSAFQPKFVRRNRPQSAPAVGKAKARPVTSPGRDRGEEEALGIEGNNAYTTVNSSFGLAGVGYVTGGGLQKHDNLWVNEHVPALADADIPLKLPNKPKLPKTEYRKQTEELFDFHDRTLKDGEEAYDYKSGNIRVMDFRLGEADEQAAKEKTARIPQRPRSANPVSRGVSNPLRHAEGASARAETAATGARGAGATATSEELNIAGAPPPGAEKTGKPARRTREEELQHIAAARSNKELSLKEKVLMKELKRLQGRGDKVVV